MDLQDRLDYAGQRMNDLNSVAITYSRGGKAVSIENANAVASDVLEQDIHGTTIILQQLQDFIFDASLLGCFVPKYAQKGDVITYRDETFSVVEINNRTFKYTTSSRKRIRVYTQQIS